MIINTSTAAYAQMKNISGDDQKTVRPLPAQVNSAQDEILSTKQAQISGKGLMMSRLFGGTDSIPSVQTQLTEATMQMSSVNFLTNEDRSMLSQLYAQTQQQGTDLGYVDALARDLGDYRMFGGVSANVNSGGMYDTSGRMQTFKFTETDTATAARILTSDGIAKTSLDSGFLRYALDPGFSFDHRTNFEFLEEVVNTFGQGTVNEGQPFSSKFSVYTPSGNQNFIVETSSEITLHSEEPDFRNVDGVFFVTETGLKNGFSLIDGNPVQGIPMMMLDLLKTGNTLWNSMK
ncbi:hypothetical protein [Pectobacterium punjabense]|uniref:hypothetical protein n=1 Tax=Pectobacterium punjabense TaxID=2108399 RepID=UPI0019699E55|nr:hypothetical protein [Pectobacterium punjabense]MBN3134830.1 hypothetical protein [Pectobacterium punjabense]MCE5382258.1 hypothetical protein [Pectobacterium punjabense]